MEVIGWDGGAEGQDRMCLLSADLDLGGCVDARSLTATSEPANAWKWNLRTASADFAHTKTWCFCGEKTSTG